MGTIVWFIEKESKNNQTVLFLFTFLSLHEQIFHFYKVFSKTTNTLIKALCETDFNDMQVENRGDSVTALCNQRPPSWWGWCKKKKTTLAQRTSSDLCFLRLKSQKFVDFFPQILRHSSNVTFDNVMLYLKRALFIWRNHFITRGVFFFLVFESALIFIAIN